MSTAGRRAYRVTRPQGTSTSGAASAPVVVGVDDSRWGLAAVRLAAHEAARYDRPLRIVHSFNWSSDPERLVQNELREPTERLLERAVETARAAEPGLEPTSALIEGPALTTLLRESGSAALTVIGDGGLATCNCVAADTTSVQIAARAGSSVLVARENLPAPGPVMVGLDGSTSSYAAVDFAFDAAARRVREVVVVRVWDPVEAPDGVEAEIAEQVGEALAPWRRRYPSIRVEQRVRAGDPKSLLVEESLAVELAVVSARGEQPWRGMLGAVSQALLYHSPVPVVVVRTPHELYVQE